MSIATSKPSAIGTSLTLLTAVLICWQASDRHQPDAHQAQISAWISTHSKDSSAFSLPLPVPSEGVDREIKRAPFDAIHIIEVKADGQVIEPLWSGGIWHDENKTVSVPAGAGYIYWIYFRSIEDDSEWNLFARASDEPGRLSRFPIRKAVSSISIRYHLAGSPTKPLVMTSIAR